jgi:hypothetical protein
MSTEDVGGITLANLSYSKEQYLNSGSVVTVPTSLQISQPLLLIKAIVNSSQLRGFFGFS